MQIAFCTTCRNRRSQLQQVWDHNQALIARHAHVHWVLLDFGSSDGLNEFVLGEQPRLPARFHYYRAEGPLPWHASVAKNTAHRLADAQVLVNLDCDNRIGDAIPVIQSYFGQGCRVLHLWSGCHRDGSFGRIALTREVFDWLGGYDESFHPMGFQDGDLLDRASAAGFPVLRHSSPADIAILNTKTESISECRSSGMSWEELDRLNRIKSAQNIAAGILQANPGGVAQVRVVSPLAGRNTASSSIRLVRAGESEHGDD